MKNILFTSLLAVMLLGSGCVTIDGNRRQQRRSSTIEFLYPKGEFKTELPSVPHLALPLTVGIAFVPESTGRSRSGGPSEDQKMQLLESVAKRFRSQPFINQIEIIPSAYLRPGGGFANLEQIRTMLGIDVIALVAYDQVQHTDRNLAALTYLTVVGAYVISGDNNDTRTMLDTTVFHIPSRKLLFRAPGTSQVKGHGTAAYRDQRLRRHSSQGLEHANQEMIGNLDRELTRFQVRVKERPQEYRISHAPGYSGGGDLGAFSLLLGLLILWGGRRQLSPAA